MTTYLNNILKITTRNQKREKNFLAILNRYLNCVPIYILTCKIKQLKTINDQHAVADTDIFNTMILDVQSNYILSMVTYRITSRKPHITYPWQINHFYMFINIGIYKYLRANNIILLWNLNSFNYYIIMSRFYRSA